ncbi:hypothetical protein D9613_008442 [Agrocybe pediades]|uniref:NAD-dependent epimerase/dehydratase domain-containing protein n=1 Tax=Agrocybe pediades TaxID=84607 RepID=A0A8H4VQU7_9AGAR|nr:hypothetical protein D9613_008442 [Agrocybe pediades]
MTILLTGGTGKTGAVLARLLHAANQPFVVANRSGKVPEPFTGVQFDWLNPETFENLFKAHPDIDRVYLVVPQAPDLLPIIGPFIDLCITKGVKRYVLLSATQIAAGGPGHGKVHQYLLDKGVDYSVLRTTWFMQNFTLHQDEIKEKDQISTAMGNAKVPWISTEDIAQAAFNDLTSEKSPNKEYFVLGPELYSNEEATRLLSSVLGREIACRKVTVEEKAGVYKELGFPADFAAFVAHAEGDVAKNTEAPIMDEPAHRKYIGKHTLEQFFRENRHLWIKE